MSFKTANDKVAAEPLRWDRGDQRIEEVLRLNETIHHQIRIAAEKITSLPHMSLSANEAKAMVDIYRKFKDGWFNHRNECMLSELRFNARMMGRNGDRHMYDDVETLRHLEEFNLLLLLPAKGDEILVRLMLPLGAIVGERLFIRLSKTQGLIRNGGSNSH